MKKQKIIIFISAIFLLGSVVDLRMGLDGTYMESEKLSQFSEKRPSVSDDKFQDINEFHKADNEKIMIDTQDSDLYAIFDENNEPEDVFYDFETPEFPDEHAADANKLLHPSITNVKVPEPLTALQNTHEKLVSQVGTAQNSVVSRQTDNFYSQTKPSGSFSAQTGLKQDSIESNESPTLQQITLQDAKCISINKFYLEIRKEVYKKSYNPFSFVRRYYQTPPEFGWIEEQTLLNHLETFFQSLNLDLEMLDIDKKFSEQLANELGKEYSGSLVCTSVSRISSLIYRMITLKFIPNPNKFFKTFLGIVNKHFRLSFLLLNFQNFLNCDEDFVHELYAQHVQDDNNLITEFASVYNTVVNFKEQGLKKENGKLIEKMIASTIKSGSVYLGIYLIYYASLVMTSEPHVRWAIDNVLLYQISGFVIEITKNFRNIKSSEYINEILLDLSGNSEGARMFTKDVINIKNDLIKYDEHSEKCAECKLRRQIEGLQHGAVQRYIII